MTAPFIVTSLDLELRWGLLDRLGTNADGYRANLEGVAEAAPRLLEAFAARKIGATWAVVGALCCADWEEWAERVPKYPAYADTRMRWHDGLRAVDPKGRLHFAPGLVDLVRKTPGQELGSHTFSHIYLREPGITRADVDADCAAMCALFTSRWGEPPRSLVFPRNQAGFVDAFDAHGITRWRDNPHASFWRATAAAERSPRVRALCLLDAFAPIGRRGEATAACCGSYFVRVGLPAPLWRLHMHRIVRDAAALRDGESLHLWWHPHNLGAAPKAHVERIGELYDRVRDVVPEGTRFAAMGDS